ncbi:hypothetical protein NC981_11015 [Leptolyngbya sp. DQ-M1]|uniref:hypothetical protein n=1 Tax=Leptolyngbya sp. DQ-M1 TaxID=2933920 RepID=UPI003297DD89
MNTTTAPTIAPSPKRRSTIAKLGVGAIVGAVMLGAVQTESAIALSYDPTPTTFATGLN